jgi:hypothetical protein
MAKRSLGERGLRAALEAMGNQLDWPAEVEVVVVGGAAAILTGQLRDRLTVDCDVVSHSPRDAWGALEASARRVTHEQGLPADWFNAETETLAHRLPDGWRRRSIIVGRFGRITIVAIGRRDLIAMKFIAGRAEDIEDLRRLRVTPDEAEHVRAYLHALAERHPAREGGDVQDALVLLEEGRLIR